MAFTTVCAVPENYPAEIIGYAEPWIVSPGEEVDIKVSCTEPQYSHRTVRLIQGYEGSNGPPKVEEEITSIPKGTEKGRFQLARPGSYAIVKDLGLSQEDSGIGLSFFIQPHLPEAGHPQILLSNLDVDKKTGIAVVINDHGEIEFWIGTEAQVEGVVSGFLPTKKRWTKIDIEISGKNFRALLSPKLQLVEKAQASKTIGTVLKGAVKFTATASLIIAGGYASSPSAVHPFVTSFYNGRIDALTIKAIGARSRLLVKYDFAKEMASDNIVDVSAADKHGVLINAPTRALKGHDWDGSEVDWTKAKFGYGAIHFHEDDLDDACWETDFRIRIPEDARSGAYAVEIEGGSAKDKVVFFVRPTPASTAKLGAKVAMVLSTFTYLAYTNEHLFDEDGAHIAVPDMNFKKHIDENYRKMDRRRDLGLSHYDMHRDLSGVVFSSAKRPILNLKPNYIIWSVPRPREFSADLLMIGFLEKLNIPYDVVTDHDLHLRGADALSQYTTVITGCHPEYPSVESYNAYTDFAKRGGNLMYLGGNGFYWASATDSSKPHRMEVRRGEQGVVTSGQDPGERMHSTNGQHGGLWRGRGRAANYLFGVGCCGEGTGDGVPYKRTPDLDASLSWIFDGIPEEDLIGEKGFGGGASGDEIDRMDHALGSPLNSIVIASSTGHPDSFGLFPEDSGFPMINTLGTQTDLIRSDMVYYETAIGGKVFSVGSISWYDSMAWEGYENHVARLTENVVRNFLEGV